MTKEHVWQADVWCVLEYWSDRKPDISATHKMVWGCPHDDPEDAWDFFLENFSLVHKMPWLEECWEDDEFNNDVQLEDWGYEDGTLKYVGQEDATQ